MILKWNIFHLTRHLFLPQFSVIKDKEPTEEFLLKYDVGQYIKFWNVNRITNFVLKQEPSHVFEETSDSFEM